VEETTTNTLIEGRLKYRPVNSHSVCMTICLVILFFIFGVIQAEAKWPRVIPSKDGIPISFEVYGTGEPTLVFVHGWSCDARYWRAQVPHFSKNHRVVTIDLAGHGHSGTTRSDMPAAPPAVALSAMNNMISQYITGEAAKIFDEIRIPVITVNGDMWPINYEANRRHMSFFEAIILKGADHFLMLDRPKEFNQALEKAILTIIKYKTK
jgi:pimeloyl-ACP methyl ester carboxylesterase